MGTHNKFPMYMLFETYLCRDFIEGFLEENKLHFELVLLIRKRIRTF